MFGSMSSAKDAMEFQEKLYKHRFRWAMKDMRLAGLNPMLAYSQAGGGVPGGAQYQAPNILEGAANSAAAYPVRKSELESQAAQRKVLKEEAFLRRAQGDKTVTEEWLAREQALKSQMDRQVSAATAGNIAADTRLKAAGLPLAEADAAFYKTEVGQALRTLERASGSVTGVLGGLQRMIPGRRRGK